MNHKATSVSDNAFYGEKWILAAVDVAVILDSAVLPSLWQFILILIGVSKLQTRPALEGRE